MSTGQTHPEIKEKILTGLEKAYRKMLEFKKQKGTPLVVMREGKIVRIKPE